MCPVIIDELTSRVRAVDDARIDPKIEAFLRKTCADLVKLEKERASAPDESDSEKLVRTLKAAVKAAGQLIDKCDEIEHEAVIRAMKWIEDAAKTRVKEIAADDAKRRRDEKAR